MLNRLNTALSDLEIMVRRIGLIGTAVLLWDVAVLVWENGNIGVEKLAVPLTMVYYAVSFLMIFLAVIKSPPRKATWLILVALFLAVSAYSYRQILFDQQENTGTDIFLFSDYSAYLARMGENPYQYDLGDSFTVYRMRSIFSTPRLEGDFSGQAPYPAFSFLLFIPFQLAHIPTPWIYVLFQILAFLVLFWGAPSLIRPVILLPLFIEWRYWGFVLGGGNDSVWVFFLCMMIVGWRNRTWSGIWYGLTIAFKQQPWLLAPLLFIRLWHESEGLPLRPRLLEIGRFFGIAALIFIGTNFPYMIWDFRAWLSGVLQPFTDSMIVLGQGLSTLTMVYDVIISRTMYTVFVLLVYGVALFVYWRHFRSLRSLLWIVPGFVLWFGNRSLSSYWFFYIIPLLLGLVRDHLDEPQSAPRHVSWKPTAAVIGGAAVFIALMITRAALTPNPVTITVQKPIEATGDFVRRLRVHVVNNSDTDLHPRFSTKAWSHQPFYWDIENGPRVLHPGESAYYMISSDLSDRWLSIIWGGQIIVTDSESYSLRAATRLAAETAYVQMDNLPADSFAYWIDGAPRNWAFLTMPTPNNGLIEMLPSTEVGNFLRLTLFDATSAHHNLAVLDTWATFFEVPAQIWVKPPALANNPDNFDLVYGFELLATFSGQRVWVLFGDERRTGFIEPGLPYYMIPAPREAWSLQSIDPTQIFTQLGLAIPPAYNLNTRFDNYDFPKRMLNFRLLLGARSQPPGAVFADFGPIVNTQQTPDPERLIRRTVENPVDVLIMRGDNNRAVQNDEAAARYYQQALDVDPTSGSAYYGLAEISLRAENWEVAQRQFEQALELGYVRKAAANGGLAWAHYQLRDYRHAQDLIELAVEQAGAQRYYYNNPQMASLFNKAGWIYLAQRKLDKAEESFIKSFDLDSYTSDTFFGMGAARLLAADDLGAIVYMREAVNLGFNDFDSRLAQVLTMAERCEDATRFTLALNTGSSDTVGAFCRQYQQTGSAES